MCLRALLDRAFAEISKQVFGSRVVFDREICEMAEKAVEHSTASFGKQP
jgi:hypothetical protein